MGRKLKSHRQFTVREMLLLVMFITTWLAITVQLGPLSILFWGLAVVMTAILRPAHQRRQTPEAVMDVLTVAVSWAVACGIVGLAVDVRLPGSLFSNDFSWTYFSASLSWAVIGQLTGFYLGLLWVLVVILFRSFEQAVGLVRRPRPIA